MGIGNTCSASAVACLLLNEPAEKLTGVGTGIRQEQLSYKKQVIDQAIELHKSYAGSDAFKILSAVGGFRARSDDRSLYTLCTTWLTYNS